MLSDFFKLLRTKHYLKNFLIFVPLFFSTKFFEWELLRKVIYAFVPFCMATSAVYILNDIHDIEKDRKHPTKCSRPLAKGTISVRTACIMCFVLAFLCMVLSVGAVFFNLYSASAVLLLIVYVVLNIFYSIKLKEIPIIDILILATGFVIRVYYGAYVAMIEVSPWLYLTILGGSFYLGMGKRRNELLYRDDNDTREVLKKYNYDFLDKNMHICVAFTEVCYALWTIQNSSASESHHSFLKWTVPLVMVIFMRYSYNIESEYSEGNPIDVIMGDKIMIVLVLLLGLCAFLGIYVF